MQLGLVWLAKSVIANVLAYAAYALQLLYVALLAGNVVNLCRNHLCERHGHRGFTGATRANKAPCGCIRLGGQFCAERFRLGQSNKLRDDVWAVPLCEWDREI